MEGPSGQKAHLEVCRSAAIFWTADGLCIEQAILRVA